MTPRNRSSGRRSAWWPASRSSSRERVLLGVRRVPHWNAGAYADDRGDGRQERETLSTNLLGFEEIRDVPGPCSPRSHTASEQWDRA